MKFFMFVGHLKNQFSNLSLVRAFTGMKMKNSLKFENYLANLNEMSANGCIFLLFCLYFWLLIVLILLVSNWYYAKIENAIGIKYYLFGYVRVLVESAVRVIQSQIFLDHIFPIQISKILVNWAKAWPVYQNFSYSSMILALEKEGLKNVGFELSLLCS